LNFTSLVYDFVRRSMISLQYKNSCFKSQTPSSFQFVRLNFVMTHEGRCASLVCNSALSI
jgi:hypothetical protein